MRKVAIIFVIAVFVPSLILAWLAVRSLRDQQFVLERQQSLLYQGVTESLARQINTLLQQRLHEFGGEVEAMLAEDSPAQVAAGFDDRLQTHWPAARVGFAVTRDGEILSPNPSGRPEARAFRKDNAEFLGNRQSAEVYLSAKQFLNVASANALGPSPDSASLKQQSVAPRISAQSDALQGGTGGGAYTKEPPSRTIVPQKLAEPGNLNAPGAEAQFAQQQPSKVAPAEAEFQELIGEASEGMLARFVNNKLNVLLWYRSPRDARFIFGAQLDLPRLKDQLRDQIPAAEPELRSEICVAILDDNARPAALSHPDFKANWKRPFVATEIGEALPRWEAAAYLLNPARLSQSARALKLTLGLLIALLLGAIATGSWLIVTDLNRQLTLARQKTDFVSNVSHELKTPLTSIRMFSELLSEGRVTDSAKQRSYFQIISAETARLTRLINNVLDFSRMDRGEKKYTMQDCDLLQIVRDTVDSYRPHLENSGFTLSCDLPAGELAVRADCDAVAQVLVNLLSNAEKYCDGRKEIAIEAVRRDSLPPGAEIRILDRGVGVPRGCEKKIFEKFYRAHDSLSSGVQGSGLGLTLARQIARAHGGDVVYEPRDGGGSRFTLRLPLNTDHA